MAALSNMLWTFLQQSSRVAKETIEGVQTEILVLMIAIVLHSIMFRKYGVRNQAPRPDGKTAKPLDRCPVHVAPKKSSANVAMAGMKSAIGSSNLEDALKILRTVAHSWRAGLGSSPTSGPRFVVRQLLRLAVEQQKVAFLLDELGACGLLRGWASETLLEEASRQGSRGAVEAVLGCIAAHEAQLSSATLCTLLHSARSAGAASHMLVDALKQHGDREDVIAAAANAAVTHSDVNVAALAFAKLPDNPGSELGAAAVKLVGEGLVKNQSVLQLYEERLLGTDLLHDAKAARFVADAALKAKRLDLLKELLAASSSSAYQVSLLKRFGAEGRLKDAQEIFKACPERTACLHSALLNIYVEAGEMFAAERVVASATKAGLADVITYNTVIKAYLRKDDVQRARCVIETMRSAGFAPRCSTFNEVIEVTLKRDPQAVWGLISEMEACGLKPNQVTCSLLLKNVQQTTGFADVQRTLDVVNAVAEEMDEALLSTICEACIRSGQRDLLRQQLSRQSSGDAVVVNSPQAFGTVIRAFGFVQDLDGVWATWNDMCERHIMPTSITLGCMVEALVSNDGPEAGCNMIAEMLSSTATRPLVNAVIYSSVIKGFTHQRQFDRVWEVYSEMRVDMKALQCSTATYNMLIDACARSCDMARVPGLLEEMSSQEIHPNVITFSTIIKGYVQEHQLDKAFDLLEDMKKGNKYKPDEFTYNTLLDGCARHGHYERGLKVLRDMQEAGVPPSNFTLSVLVKLAARSQRPEIAFQLCADISTQYKFKLNVHVYNNLMNACIQSHDSDRAMEVFIQALKERVRPDARTYTLMLRAALADEEGSVVAGLLRAAYGLRGVHPALASFDKSMLQVRGGLPSDVVQEVLEGMACLKAGRSLAAQLVGELKCLPSVRLDSRLALRLTSQAA